MGDNSNLIIGLIALIVIAVFIISNYISGVKRKYRDRIKEQENQLEVSMLKHEGLLNEKDLQIEKMLAEAKEVATGLATKQFEEWKGTELETHRKVIIASAFEQAKVWLAEWKIASEKGLRKDAVTRSMGVNFGKITEHLVPFSVHLENFDPRDIRFIGSPVDLMIFDGATSKKDTIDIYFVEIKTGSGQLSKKQKTIRDAIESPFPRVHWLPIVVPDFKWDVSEENE